VTRPPDVDACPACGSSEVEVVPGHGRYGNRASAPRTVICYRCQTIAEWREGEWLQVADR
jgi:hypothetical protein